MIFSTVTQGKECCVNIQDGAESEHTWGKKRMWSVLKPHFERLLPLLKVCLEYSSVKSEEKNCCVYITKSKRSLLKGELWIDFAHSLFSKKQTSVCIMAMLDLMNFILWTRLAERNTIWKYTLLMWTFIIKCCQWFQRMRCFFPFR